MIEINGKQFCENCFEKVTGTVCSSCGYNRSDSAYDPSLLVPGSVLMNRYVIGQIIGKGGFGITYLAYDALVCRKIAIKEYFPYGLAQRAIGSSEVSVTSADNVEPFRLGAEKFYNEAKLVMRFNGNPNIVGVYDSFYENNTAYMAMEYLSGCTLKEYIRKHGILSAPQALYAATNIANALVVAHSASILHRDITPDNVILCDNGDIKLIDFGAARQVVAEHSQNFSVVLKPGFAPPEQYSKKGNQGSWTDVYSLGATLYFMLTGDIPDDPSARFDDDDTFKENLFNIAPSLWGVITKATKLKLEERYSDAYELKKALDIVPIKPEPIIARDGTPAAGAEMKSESTENTANLTVSIKKPQPKQSFLRRHLRTILEITCGLLAAAMIIPLAVKVYRPAVDDNNASASNPGGSDRVAAIGTTIDVEALGYKYKWPTYSILDKTEKELYALIFLGINTNEKTIVVPSLTYNVPKVDEIYTYVLYDNPNLNHVRGFNVNYSDLNDNKEPDDNEYITAILPNYTGIDPHEANNYMNEAATTKSLDEDRIASLRYFHDKLIEETKIVMRNSNPTSSTTHGAVIENRADEIGLAKAMCGYAQRLGYYAYVTDQDLGNGTMHAWVRLKIDGAWYNIDPYYDSLMTGIITSIPVSDKVSHIYFLVGDKAYFGDLEVNEIVSDEKFYPLYTSDSGEVSPNENYYVEKYLGKAYYGDIQLTYNAVLEETQKQLNNSGEIVSVYVSPDIVDDLWATMQESYISDLAGKGVTISEFTAEYSDDSIHITLKK